MWGAWSFFTISPEDDAMRQRTLARTRYIPASVMASVFTVGSVICVFGLQHEIHALRRRPRSV
jgi:type VI protein secretion system component VasF